MSNFALQSISKTPGRLLIHQRPYTKVSSRSSPNSPSNIYGFCTPPVILTKNKQETLKGCSYSRSPVSGSGNHVRGCDVSTPIKSPRVRLFNIKSNPPSPLPNNSGVIALSGKNEIKYRLGFKTLKFKNNWEENGAEKYGVSLVSSLQEVCKSNATADFALPTLSKDSVSEVQNTKEACNRYQSQKSYAKPTNFYRKAENGDGTPILLNLLHSKRHQVKTNAGQKNLLTADGQQYTKPNGFCSSDQVSKPFQKHSQKNAICNESGLLEVQEHCRPADLSSIWALEPVCFNTPIRNRLFNNGLDGFDKKPYILGRGGFGVVVLVSHKGRQLAVKIMKKNCKRRRSIEIAIQNEENVIGLDQHPNVVQTLNICGIKEQHALIMMEFAGTRHLASILEDGTEVIDQIRRLRFATQIAGALQWCHCKRIAHLDVKPANIIVSDNDMCKLGDFGCSKHIDKLTCIEDWHLLGGTIAYRAPELLRENSVTLKADVYSFAITLWQLLTREVPFWGWDAHTIVYKVVACDARPQNPAASDPVTSNYINFYSGLWLREIEMRPTMEEIAQKLRLWQS